MATSGYQAKRDIVVAVLEKFQEGLLFTDIVELLAPDMEETTRFGGKAATVRQFLSQLMTEGRVIQDGERYFLVGSSVPPLPTRNIVPRWQGAHVDLTFDSNNMDGVVRIDYSRDRTNFDAIPLGVRMKVHIGDNPPDWPRAVVIAGIRVLRFYMSDGEHMRSIDCEDFGNRPLVMTIVNAEK